MIRRAVQTRGDDVDGSGGDKRTGDESADDLSLRSGERDGEGGGDGRREESGGEGEEVELAVESDGGAGSRGARLAERDVGDGAGAAEETEADASLAAEAVDGGDDVVSGGDLEDVRAHGRLQGEVDRRFRFVFRTLGSATWTLTGDGFH